MCTQTYTCSTSAGVGQPSAAGTTMTLLYRCSDHINRRYGIAGRKRPAKDLAGTHSMRARHTHTYATLEGRPPITSHPPTMSPTVNDATDVSPSLSCSFPPLSAARPPA